MSIKRGKVIIQALFRKLENRHYEDDFIVEVTQKVLVSEDEGGLVFNKQEQLVGTFTYQDLLRGFIEGKRFLSEVYRREFNYVQVDADLVTLDIEKHPLCPVVNQYDEIQGFLTKSSYYQAIATRNEIARSQLDAIFNSAHNGILSIDVEGKITAINPAAEKMAKTTKDESVGQYLNDIVVPTGLLNVIRTGECHTEKFVVGSRKYLAHRSPIFEGKRLVGAVGVFQDISEIELISNELYSVKQIVNELNTIMNHSDDGICITNADGKMIRKNHAFDRLYYDSLNEESRISEFGDMIQEVVSSGKPFRSIEKNSRNNQSIIVSAIPVKNEKKAVERVVISIKDMTEIDALRGKLETTKFMLRNIQEDNGERRFIVHSNAMRKLVEKIKQIAKIDITTLLIGESGVGKEEIAKKIVEWGPRKDKPFIKLNCGMLFAHDMESELFGMFDHQKDGTRKIGMIEHANGGTLFIEEIEALPLPIQRKLLDVMKNQTVIRARERGAETIDVRFIVSTSKDLEELVEENIFREDLFYHLNILSLRVPPLRERVEEIPDFIQHFFNEFTSRYKKELHVNNEALHRLLNYEWPGNISELMHVLEHLFITTTNSNITLEQVEAVIGKSTHEANSNVKPIVVNKVIPLREAVEELERQLISLAKKSQISYRKIAQLLEVNPSTIVRKVKKLEENEKKH